MKINQPATNIKLENVAIVRLKKGGKRFEIACYKNKIQEYRKGYEKELSNVLQIEQIFTNVSKGTVASTKELEVFKKEKQDIIKEILEKGDEQLNEKERQLMKDQMYKEVIEIIIQKTWNPETKKPYTFSMIDKIATKNINTMKSTKQQALEIMNDLIEKQPIPIQKRPLAVRIKKWNDDALKLFLEHQVMGDHVTGTIDPSHVSKLKEFDLEFL
jgi:ribosome maturation protein SDO1